MTATRTPGPTGQLIPLPAGPDDPLLLTVTEAARRLRISRSLMFELLAAGQIESLHVGRLRRIPVQALHDYVQRLRDHQPDPTAA